MVTVAIVTPWIEVDCPWRWKARNHTTAYWWNLGYEVVYGESDARPLNRAQARNRAAEATDAQVLFFADADMWVPEQQFQRAVDTAWLTGHMVLAYVDHMRLNRWSTERVYEGKPSYQGQSIKGCSSGAFAVTRELFDEIGGHDERFLGWGGEDRAFMFACEALSDVERIPGLSYHLWHPRGKDQARADADRKAGIELAERYKRLAGVKPRSGIIGATRDAVRDPEGMRALLREPGGPLDTCFPNYTRGINDVTQNV